MGMWLTELWVKNDGVSATILADEGDLLLEELDDGPSSFRNVMEYVKFVKNEWKNETGMKLRDNQACTPCDKNEACDRWGCG